MARGFLSEGGRRDREDDGDVTVDLELGWSTEKAWGFRDPFDKTKPANLVGGAREKLIWCPREIRGEPLQWRGREPKGAGKLTGPRWLLEQKGLI